MRQRLRLKERIQKLVSSSHHSLRRLLIRLSSTGQQKMAGSSLKVTIEAAVLLCQIEERRQGILDV